MFLKVERMEFRSILYIFIFCIISINGEPNTTNAAGTTTTTTTELPERPVPAVVQSLAGGSTRVSHIGNPHIGRNAGVEKGGVTFLLNDVILREGVVFAFASYFRNDKPAAFQLWRPTGSSGKQFKLISSLKVIPAVDKAVEQIYITSKLDFNSCVRVYKEDRLGVYFPTDEGSVAYAFDPDEPSALLYESPDAKIAVNVSEVVDFTSLNFPYDFSMSAYIDAEYPDLDTYDPDQVLLPCPRNLLIPEHIHEIPDFTTRAPLTGAPGATGPAGPQGLPGAIGATGVMGPAGILGFTGFTGPMGNGGATGFTGPVGNNGNEGPAGSMGATGMQGAKGDKGDVGSAGPPGKTVYVNANGTIVKDPNAVAISAEEDNNNVWWIILLVWLIIVTIIIIILIIILCIIRRKYYMVRKDGIYSQSDLKASWISSMENGTSKSLIGSGSMGSDAIIVVGDEPTTPTDKSNRPTSTISGIQASWMGTLKDDADAQYDVGTIKTLKEEDTKDTDSAKYMNVEDSFPTDTLTRKNQEKKEVALEDIHSEV